MVLQDGRRLSEACPREKRFSVSSAFSAVERSLDAKKPLISYEISG